MEVPGCLLLAPDASCPLVTMTELWGHTTWDARAGRGLWGQLSPGSHPLQHSDPLRGCEWAPGGRFALSWHLFPPGCSEGCGRARRGCPWSSCSFSSALAAQSLRGGGQQHERVSNVSNERGCRARTPRASTHTAPGSALLLTPGKGGSSWGWLAAAARREICPLCPLAGGPLGTSASLSSHLKLLLDAGEWRGAGGMQG